MTDQAQTLISVVIHLLFWGWTTHVAVKRGRSALYGLWGLFFAIWGLIGVALWVKRRPALLSEQAQ